jgi:hypothetical protein
MRIEVAFLKAVDDMGCVDRQREATICCDLRFPGPRLIFFSLDAFPEPHSMKDIRSLPVMPECADKKRHHVGDGDAENDNVLLIFLLLFDPALPETKGRP